MTAGIPGAGFGGVFYVLSALWMPVCELWRTMRGESSGARWKVVGTQTAMALAILGAMGLTNWLIAQFAPEAWLAPLLRESDSTAPGRTLFFSSLGAAVWVIGALVAGTRLIHLALLFVEFRERLRIRRAYEEP